MGIPTLNRFLVLSSLLGILLTGCLNLPPVPAPAIVPPSLPTALELAQEELLAQRWGKAWILVANRTEVSTEKAAFLSLLESQLVDRLAEAKTQAGGRKTLDLEATLSLIQNGSWVPPVSEAVEVEGSQASLWLKGTATVLVNRGLKVENGASQPDIVIGSGFFVSSDGFLLTNHHVIESEVEPGPSLSSRLSVRLPGSKGERLPAKVIGWDRNMDLALLKVEFKPEFVFSLSSGPDLIPGQRLQALGSPGGLEATLTEGIVSAVHRPLLAVGEVMQIDAAINPGNSGGPLVDSDGRVVGVVFAGIRDFQGVNFAIPTSLVRRVLPLLYSGGKAVLPWMGMGVQEDHKGLQVLYITPRGPADWAGVRIGDRVVGIAGVPTQELSAAQIRLLDFGIDAVIPLDLEREGRPLRLWSTLEPRPDFPLRDAARDDLTERVLPLAYGVIVEDRSPGLDRVFRVKSIWPGTAAEELSLAENDPLEVLEWVADTENKALITRWKIKRRLGGYLESVVQLAVPFSSRLFL